MEVTSLFNLVSNIKVLVVGDVMLDEYLFGSVERISPEAPVPIYSLNNKETRIGGAGNVACNLSSIGTQTFVASVLGEDDQATLLLSLFKNAHINVEYCVQDKTRPTTAKTRLIAKSQQLLRIDAETTKYIDPLIEAQLLEKCLLCMKLHKPDVLILEDYNKGVLTKSFIRAIMKEAQVANMIVAVDPKKNNFFEYIGATIFKPNFKEILEAFNKPSVYSIDVDSLNELHLALVDRIKNHMSLVTLSEHGVFFATNNCAKIIPAHVRNIADVSGAGDTVIAVASVVYAVTKNIQLASELANIAGGIVCEEIGTRAIDKNKLLSEVIKYLGNNLGDC
ncbi:MAG: PfkB family carbohydrate kinase [Phycisphaerales bacterium]|nr:PfkB family carbohydrate kinase [Phycisphaerales bacterium]